MATKTFRAPYQALAAWCPLSMLMPWLEENADSTSVNQRVERQTHYGALLGPRVIPRYEGIALPEDCGRGVNRIGHLDAVVCEDVGGEFEDLIRDTNEDDAVVAEELLEPFDPCGVTEANRHDEAFCTNESRRENGASPRVLHLAGPADNGCSLEICALNRTPDNAGVKVEPHRYQPSRISRISASIWSPVIVPGGSERMYSDKVLFGATDAV